MKTFRALLARHDWIVVVFIMGVLLASVYGTVTYVQAKARNQAMARAQRMDGKTFTITAVGYNFTGDTKLVLTDENGQDAGWIAMYMANPLNDKINPLFLALTNPYGPSQ